MKTGVWKRWGAVGAVSFVLVMVVVLTLAATPGGGNKLALAQTAGTPTPAAQPGTQRQITVSTIGKVQAAPDVAYLNIGTVTQAPTAREALDKANAAADKIRQALVDAGIPAQDVQTQGINAYPIQNPGKDGSIPTEPSGYRSNVNFNITINDLSKAGAALDAATQAGANEIGGLNYGIKDDSTLRTQALEQAVKQAQPKAEALARGLGLQLGQVLTVVEDPNGYYGGPAYGVGAGGKGDSIAPGQLTVSVRVTVSYAIQ